MKIIILCAFFALVSAKSLLDNPMLQTLYDCRPGEKCADKIKNTSDNFPEAVEKACPKCSPDQKKNMASFVEALSKGVPIEEAMKLYNPHNKYFDVVDNPDTAFTFNATVTVNAS